MRSKRPTPHTDAIKDAAKYYTLYGILTPYWFESWSRARHRHRKPWWKDDTPPPDTRQSGPWDTEETRGDDVVDIVDIAFDAKAHWGDPDDPEPSNR